jgi:hypothetical protein
MKAQNKLNMLNIPALSFCITCKNRFHQISGTLKRNLDDNSMYSHLIEFVLVDFGSDDGLKEWILDNFQKELKANYLKFYYTDGMKSWHASLAKNTAHILAANDILVNLDCDNFTGRNGGKFVIQQFLNNEKNMIFHQFSGKYYDGSFGRIGMYRKTFHETGGYDERFEPMGGQDGDLINRLLSLGYKYVLAGNEKYNRAIPNSKDESIAFTGSKLSWTDMNHKNQVLSKRNISNGLLAANGGYLNLKYNIKDVYGDKMLFRQKY